MLAEFFDRPTLPDSRYPDHRLDLPQREPRHRPRRPHPQAAVAPDLGPVDRIDSLSSTDKIDHVTSQPSQLLQLSIDDLEDRAAMLQDVRARISFLKRDLGNLLTSLPAVDATTPPAPATAP